MSDSAEQKISAEFNTKDYVDAATDAATRTRTVTVVLVVASVLISIGWYNSLRSSWQLHRVRQAFDSNPEYVAKVLDEGNHPDIFKEERVGQGTPADKFRQVLREQTLKAYIENVRFVKTPFFGIAFDVNDLGLIGGVSLIIILLLMRYSLSREIKNLNISFKQAVAHDQLCPFYHFLAMRQVFTVPHMIGEKRNRWLGISPRIICILPTLVFLLGVFYDWYSTITLRVYHVWEVRITLIIETLWLVLIGYLSWRCWERQSHIDHTWRTYWRRLSGLKSSVVHLEKDLIEEFGSDKAVNSALRKIHDETKDLEHATVKAQEPQMGQP